jgi:hypothetical protein
MDATQIRLECLRLALEKTRDPTQAEGIARQWASYVLGLGAVAVPDAGAEAHDGVAVNAG